MSGLLDRLRTGPSSRELDAEIARALGVEDTHRRVRTWSDPDRRYLFSQAVRDDIPAYTTDINAALGLVPDGVAVMHPFLSQCLDGKPHQWVQTAHVTITYTSAVLFCWQRMRPVPADGFVQKYEDLRCERCGCRRKRAT